MSNSPPGTRGRFFALALAQRRFVSKLATSHGGSERGRAFLSPGYVFDRGPREDCRAPIGRLRKLNQLVVSHADRSGRRGVAPHFGTGSKVPGKVPIQRIPFESWRTPQKDGKKATAIERLIFRRFCLSQFQERWSQVNADDRLLANSSRPDPSRPPENKRNANPSLVKHPFAATERRVVRDLPLGCSRLRRGSLRRRRCRSKKSRVSGLPGRARQAWPALGRRFHRRWQSWTRTSDRVGPPQAASCERPQSCRAWPRYGAWTPKCGKYRKNGPSRCRSMKSTALSVRKSAR